MLSKENKDLVQLQHGNLELGRFPDISEDDFSKKGQIQSGKKNSSKPEDSPPMGSGFHHDIFEKD